MALRSKFNYFPSYGNRILTQPAIEPVTLDEVKDQLRLDASDTSQDAWITANIPVARQIIEEFTGIAFISQQWLMTLDRWPNLADPWWDGVQQGAIGHLQATGRGDKYMRTYVELPRYPLLQLVSVKTYDINSNVTDVNVAQTFDVDKNRLPGRFSVKAGQAWPTATRPTAAIEIEYEAGYGPDAADVPVGLRQAIIRYTAAMFENRGEGCCDNHTLLSKSGVSAILDKYRVITI